MCRWRRVLIRKTHLVKPALFKDLADDGFEAATRVICEQSELALDAGPALRDVITMQQERAKTLVELVERVGIFTSRLPSTMPRR